MNLFSPVKGAIARRLVAAFLLIAIGALLVTAAIPPLTATDIPPFDSPLFGVVGGILGVGLGAFVVTRVTAGRAGVVDLARRTLRWRVPLRWYLIALFGVPVAAMLLALAIYGPEALESPPGGWPEALAEVTALFVIQLVLFQLAEEIGFTGFLQDRWQARFSALRLTVYVAFFRALWHVPDPWGAQTRSSCKSADPTKGEFRTRRPSLERNRLSGLMAAAPIPTQRHAFWDRQGRAIRRSTSQFFGVIRVGRQHSVPPANGDDSAV